jgi:hypothetical protein
MHTSLRRAKQGEEAFVMQECLYSVAWRCKFHSGTKRKLRERVERWRLEAARGQGHSTIMRHDASPCSCPHRTWESQSTAKSKKHTPSCVAVLSGCSPRALCAS